jgi:hypothetical protein
VSVVLNNGTQCHAYATDASARTADTLMRERKDHSPQFNSAGALGEKARWISASRMLLLTSDWDLLVAHENNSHSKRGPQASHLCHQAWCIRPDHITIETPQQNSLRNFCHATNACDHTPKCLVPGPSVKKKVVVTSPQTLHAMQRGAECLSQSSQVLTQEQNSTRSSQKLDELTLDVGDEMEVEEISDDTSFATPKRAREEALVIINIPVFREMVAPVVQARSPSLGSNQSRSISTHLQREATFQHRYHELLVHTRRVTAALDGVCAYARHVTEECADNSSLTEEHYELTVVIPPAPPAFTQEV